MLNERSPKWWVSNGILGWNHYNYHRNLRGPPPQCHVNRLIFRGYEAHHCPLNNPLIRPATSWGLYVVLGGRKGPSSDSVGWNCKSIFPFRELEMFHRLQENLHSKNHPVVKNTHTIRWVVLWKFMWIPSKLKRFERKLDRGSRGGFFMWAVSSWPWFLFLLYIGDEHTTQYYGDYFISHDIRIPSWINQVWWNVMSGVCSQSPEAVHLRRWTWCFRAAVICGAKPAWWC